MVATVLTVTPEKGEGVSPPPHPLMMHESGGRGCAAIWVRVACDAHSTAGASFLHAGGRGGMPSTHPSKTSQPAPTWGTMLH